MKSPRCDQCGKEATIHEYKGAQGQVVSEVHLCEACATELGLVGKSFKNVEQILQHVIQIKAAGTKPAPKAGGCPNCGMTWAVFREHGLLGCPQCYDFFESQLGPLIERAHEGGTHHVGKARQTQSADLALRVQTLRKQLAEALAAEQYERAAELRDQLTSLGVEPGAGGSSGSGKPVGGGKA